MKTTADVVREINRKATAEIRRGDCHHAHESATLDDVLCAIVFVAFAAFVCLL